jgi:predicted GNAT superfamily acetyltransferase
VVVDPAVHASGIGKALYADIEAFARERASKIACEVNTVPPNERSQRFHHSLGFRQVGIKSTNEGAKQVSLLIKPLD